MDLSKSRSPYQISNGFSEDLLIDRTPVIIFDCDIICYLACDEELMIVQ